MAVPDTFPPGYRSTVHHGPLQPVTIWKAPYEYALPNILVAMAACLYISWRWVFVAAVVHVVLMLFWLYDPFLLPILIRHLRYRSFYGVR